jgi:hypothetical protein
MEAAGSAEVGNWCNVIPCVCDKMVLLLIGAQKPSLLAVNVTCHVLV